MSYTATYSPEDNKLRLYASTRLDAETYARAKEMGFRWAPKQELFVAPMWTPGREDFLIELVGEIDDEDTSLVDRAEERAERFEDYSDKRLTDANRAHSAVKEIADNIPFGQPILVGHHSERHARKDAQRIENGMRRAVNMWKTSKYWTDRAAGAIEHAKYKERPDVRARRIKGIEADLRKAQKNRAEAQHWLALWTKEGLTHEQGVAIANRCWLHLPRKEGDLETHSGQPTAYNALTNYYPNLYAPRTLAEVVEYAARAYPRTIEHCDRWIEHYQNRLAYERAMMAEQIGAESHATRFDFQPGGAVMVRRDGAVWYTILRVNKSGGAANSLTLAGRKYVNKVGVEDVTDYKAPDAETAAKVKKATALAPLCNYPGEGFAHLTKAEYDKIPADYKGGREVKATAEHGRHRLRYALGCYARKDCGDDWNKRHAYNPVFLTDAPRKDPPAPEPDDDAEPVTLAPERVAPPAPALAPTGNGGEHFEALEATLKAGVQVVSAPQLFPTPPDIARQMVELAGVRPGHRVLEPSAGTGRLLEALPAGCHVTAVEKDVRLAEGLERFAASVFAADFLADFTPGNVGTVKYDRVLMNPPFERGADIAHIKHAAGMLKPGGRLVALCANSPRQQDALRPLASDWRELPAGSFKSEGTGVNVALLVIDAPAEAPAVAYRKSLFDEATP